MEMDKNIITEEKETNMGQQLMAKYLPYWPLLVLFILLSVAAAYGYLKYATPIYEASATIIIKDETRGGSEDAKLIESLVIASKKTIENEIEVLHSRSLMEKVVKAQRLYASYLKEGKLRKGDAYALTPIVIEAQNPDSIVGVQKMEFSYDKSNQIVLVNNKDKYPLNKFVSTPFGILKFLPNKYPSSALNAEDSKFFFSLDEPQNVASVLTKILKISPNKQSAIVEISYRDWVAQRAVDILNQLIITYEQVSIIEKNSLAKNTLTFVNEQLRGVTIELDSIEKKIQQYKSGSGAVDIGTQGGFYLKNVGENDQKLGDINMQLSMLNQVDKFVGERQNGEMLAPSTLGVSDPSLSNLITQLQTTQMEYDKLKKTVGENNPKLKALEGQINSLRPSITDNIKNQKQSLIASRQSLNVTNSGYNAMLSTVPKKEKQLLEISREHMTKANQYQTLLQKQQEIEMSLASVISNSRVVDKAMAGSEPVSPKKMMIYMMAIIGALGAFVGIIILKDTITGKIKFRNEIEKMTSIPIIGEIAFEKTQNPLVIEKGTRSFVAEEFRKLRVSLSFLGIDSAHKKILLTSSISGEGKSFVAANLAVSISLTGKKVVLVDLDLNQPTLSKIMNVHYEYGATEFLTGEKDAYEVVNKLNTHENLHFISAGNLPENPTELLANGKVEKLIEYLENNYDMVVIDTSPSALVTDAFILSKLCDATLYVIRHNYTPKMLIKRIDENNQINPIKNPAIIFNGLKNRGIFKNNYGYGYNYVYGNKEYGYGSKNRKQKKSA